MTKIEKEKKALDDLNQKSKAQESRIKTLYSEIKKIETSKADIVNKLEIIKHNITVAKDEFAILSEKNQVLRAERDSLNNNITAECARIQGLQDVIEMNNNQLNRDKEEFKKKESNLLKQEKSLNKKQVDFDNAKDDYINKEKKALKEELDKIRDESRAGLKDVKYKSLELDKKLKELASKITAAEESKSICDSKIKSLDILTEDMSQAKHLYQESKRITDENNKKLQELTSSLEISKEEYEKAKVSFERQLQSLATQEKEIKIKELRVRKLIKDNQLDKEIAQLENALK
jgi:hypothetical protein